MLQTVPCTTGPPERRAKGTKDRPRPYRPWKGVIRLPRPEGVVAKTIIEAQLRYNDGDMLNEWERVAVACRVILWRNAVPYFDR